MAWQDTLKKIASAAPLLGRLLPIPGAGVAGDLIAAAFGTKNDPESLEAAINADPNAVLKLREIEDNNRTLLQQQLILAETARIQANLLAESDRLKTINETMRAETSSEDPYVRRWRPTWGYATALTWTVQGLGFMAAVVWVVVATPEQAGQVFDGIAAILGSMTIIWGIALSVLGVNVHQRSKDKAVAAGQTPAPGIIASLTSRIKGG
jgi:hypothetical protein